MSEQAWYAELRERWRPPQVRILLVGESAPAEGRDGQRRFFYAPTLSRADNLFRGVIEAFYAQSPGRAGDDKTAWLARLRDDGVFLVDLVPFPVNRLPRGERRAALTAHADALVHRARNLPPRGVIVCHAPAYAVVAGPLAAAGVRVLHDQPIRFPLGNWRASFVADVRAAMQRLDAAGPDRRPAGGQAGTIRRRRPGPSPSRRWTA